MWVEIRSKEDAYNRPRGRTFKKTRELEPSEGCGKDKLGRLWSGWALGRTESSVVTPVPR